MCCVHSSSCSPPAKLENSQAAAATTKHSILSEIVISSPSALLGKDPLLCLVQDKRPFSLQEVAPFPVSYLHIQNPKMLTTQTGSA